MDFKISPSSHLSSNESPPKLRTLPGIQGVRVRYHWINAFTPKELNTLVATISLAELENITACRGSGKQARVQEAGAHLTEYPRPALLEARLKLTGQDMVSYGVKTPDGVPEWDSHVVSSRAD